MKALDHAPSLYYITPLVMRVGGKLMPTMFQAVEIEGENYWDGRYSGNPTITPLVRECKSHDTILVQINPVERTGTPKTARMTSRGMPVCVRVK